MDRYSITFTPADLGYVRQVLGQRPFDEVVQLIANIAQQRAEQDRLPQAAPTVQPGPARTRRGRLPQTKPVIGNGAATHDTDSPGL